MTKIEIFVQMFRDCSLLSKPAPAQYVHAVSYVMMNARQLTNSIETTDIPMENTVAEFMAFFYSGGPKPRFLEQNGL